MGGPLREWDDSKACRAGNRDRETTEADKDTQRKIGTYCERQTQIKRRRNRQNGRERDGGRRGGEGQTWWWSKISRETEQH